MKKKDFTALMQKLPIGNDSTGKTMTYKCSGCGEVAHAIALDPGVIPMFVDCPHCGAWMQHIATEQGVSPKASFVWHKPTFEEFCKLNEGEQTHVINGGLVLKKDGNENRNRNKKTDSQKPVQGESKD